MAEKKSVDITVLRRFRYNGKKIAVGETLTVDRHFASEMIAANKAVEGKDTSVIKEAAAKAKAEKQAKEKEAAEAEAAKSAEK